MARTERIERLIEASPEAEQVLARQALSQIEPGEVARIVLFLASDEARSITGQAITNTADCSDRHRGVPALRASLSTTGP